MVSKGREFRSASRASASPLLSSFVPNPLESNARFGEPRPAENTRRPRVWQRLTFARAGWSRGVRSRGLGSRIGAFAAGGMIPATVECTPPTARQTSAARLGSPATRGPVEDEVLAAPLRPYDPAARWIVGWPRGRRRLAPRADGSRAPWGRGARYVHLMPKLSLAAVSLRDLEGLVELSSLGITADPWDVEPKALEPEVEAQVRYLRAKLARAQPTTLNEATIWARAVYPLLELAENERCRAWAQVPIAARDPNSDAEISGTIDGVLAPEGVFAGAPGVPFLLVVEAKRGMDGADPRPQLIGALLAALWLRMSGGESPPLDAFGCYTVGDIWTFVRAHATQPVGGRLSLTLSWSREYPERSEASNILQVLRHIAA